MRKRIIELDGELKDVKTINKSHIGKNRQQ